MRGAAGENAMAKAAGEKQSSAKADRRAFRVGMLVEAESTRGGKTRRFAEPISPTSRCSIGVRYMFIYTV